MYLAGNHKRLGNWIPSGIELKRENNKWVRSIEVPKDTWLEFKITDGTWEKEAQILECAEKKNIRILADKDKAVKLHVSHWHENPAPMIDEIQGQVEYLGHFQCDGILDREVIVWLPTEYANKPQQQFPVLYMHDGQNIIDPNTAFLRSDWGMDETIEEMSRQGSIEAPIVVGIYNTSDRIDDYSDTEKGKRYLKFIAEQLKPIIDKQYRTKPQLENTAIMGSSMGGLISFLAAWYYPHVFGKAACLSPMFWGKRQVTLNAWKMVEENPSHPLCAMIYMDNGTADLERRLMPGCRHMLRVLKQRGYREHHDLAWFKDEGALHNEQAWAKRVWKPLKFLFGKK